MLMEDHIKFFDPDPLVGENLPEFGPRFCDMSFTYTPAYRAVAKEKAKELGIRLQEGVYFYCIGPQFETPAEIRAIRTLGANAVGMSTVPETIVARHCGINVMGISCITNMAAGVLPQKLTHSEVTETAARVHDTFRKLLELILEVL